MPRILGRTAGTAKESRCGKDEGCDSTWRQQGYWSNNGVHLKDKKIQKTSGIKGYFFLSFFSFRITEQTERDVVRKDKEETSRYILAHRYSLNARYQDRKKKRAECIAMPTNRAFAWSLARKSCD